LEPLRDPAFGDNGSENGWGRDVPEIQYLSTGLAVCRILAARMNARMN
jgi:hypothetical protein